MARLKIKKAEKTAETPAKDSANDSIKTLNDESFLNDDELLNDDVDYTTLTNNDLARIIVARGYSTRAESTLSRLSKDELLLIIAEKADERKGDLHKSNIESAQELIKIYIDFMDEIKKARDDKENNKTLKNFTQKQSVSIAPFLNNVSLSNYGIIALIFGLLLIGLDSIVGFKNLKELITKKVKSSENK